MISLLDRVSARTAVLKDFDARRILDYDFRLGAGNDIANASRRGLRYSSTPPITFTRASSGTYFDSAGVLQTASSNEARFDHNPVSGAPLGLPVEEQRENELTKSEEIDHADWSKTNCTVTANQVVAPDGNTAMDALVENTTDAQHEVLQSTTGTDSGTDVGSIFVTAGTRDWVHLALLDSSSSHGYRVWFDVANGAKGSSSQSGSGVLVDYDIVDIGGGIYRCWVVVDKVGGDTEAQFRVGAGTGDSNRSYAGTTDAEALYLWGADVNHDASFPTSYIKTTTAAVTRSIDVCSTTDVSWFNNSEGTFLVEFKQGVLAVPATPQYYFQISDGGANNRINLQTQNATGRAQVEGISAAGDNLGINTGNVAADTVHKVAFAYRVDDGAGSLDGAAIVTDSSYDPWTTTATLLHIQNNKDGTVAANGHISRLVYWNTRLSNAHLQALTS